MRILMDQSTVINFQFNVWLAAKFYLFLIIIAVHAHLN